MTTICEWQAERTREKGRGTGAGTDQLGVEWDTYAWYREAALDCAAREGLRPIQVERALYALGDAMPGATWAAYAARIEDQLAHLYH
jgi:hypothetical protein